MYRSCEVHVLTISCASDKAFIFIFGHGWVIFPVNPVGREYRNIISIFKGLYISIFVSP